MTPFVVNTLGAMQGGAVASIAAAAATAAADAELGRPTTCVDLEINYLTLGRIGPIRAVPRVLRSEPDWCLVAIEVRDHGNEDRLMTVVRAVAVAADGSGADR
jgi:acyl-coenzyme A thioesterase PaaI-like protein